MKLSPMSKSDHSPVTAVEVVSELLAMSPQITELTIFEPAGVPLAQDRLHGTAECTGIVEAGLKLRGITGLPFWDSVLLSSFDRGEAAIPILQQASFHNSPPLQSFSILRSQWSTDYIAGIAANIRSDSILVLSSRAKVDGGEHRHIPMLDFHCPPSAKNQELAVQVSKLMDPNGGYLLCSGRSYHFYGKSLISDRELTFYLARALLFAPIIDRAWVAHQLLEEACGLRITQKASGLDEPYVIHLEPVGFPR
jgi:hypothetical protein